MDKPLSTFGGMIPLFVQFVDLHVQSIILRNDSLYTSSLHYLSTILRPNVIYVVVTQDDQVQDNYHSTSTNCTRK